MSKGQLRMIFTCKYLTTEVNYGIVEKYSPILLLNDPLISSEALAKIRRCVDEDLDYMIIHHDFNQSGDDGGLFELRGMPWVEHFYSGKEEAHPDDVTIDRVMNATNLQITEETASMLRKSYHDSYQQRHRFSEDLKKFLDRGKS